MELRGKIQRILRSCSNAKESLFFHCPYLHGFNWKQRFRGGGEFHRMGASMIAPKMWISIYRGLASVLEDIPMHPPLSAAGTFNLRCWATRRTSTQTSSVTTLAATRIWDELNGLVRIFFWKRKLVKDWCKLRCAWQAFLLDQFDVVLDIIRSRIRSTVIQQFSSLNVIFLYPF